MNQILETPCSGMFSKRSQQSLIHVTAWAAADNASWRWIRSREVIQQSYRVRQLTAARRSQSPVIYFSVGTEKKVQPLNWCILSKLIGLYPTLVLAPPRGSSSTLSSMSLLASTSWNNWKKLLSYVKQLYFFARCPYKITE